MGDKTIRFMRRLSVALALLVTTIVSPAVQAAGEEVVLRRGNGSEPQKLDPHKTDDRATSNILRDLFEGLVTIGPDGRIIPGIAESWSIDDEGKIYTFRLRQDLRWSNGDRLTSADVLYSFRRAIRAVANPDAAANLAVIRNGDAVLNGKSPPSELGVEAPDPLTVRFFLRVPAPYFLSMLSADNHAMPVHQASIEKFGDDWCKPENMVNNGPYTLAEWKPKDSVTLVRNPNYHHASDVKIGRVKFLALDSREELKRFEAGEIEVTNEVPQEQVKWISLTHPKEFWNRPLLATYYYAFNLTAEPFRGNAKLRQALSMAINREALVNKITRAGESPAYGFVPLGIPGYRSQTMSFVAWTQQKRIEQARRLFVDAGYSPSDPLSIDLLYNTSDNNRAIANAVSAMWRDAFGSGINITLINTDRADYLKRRSQRSFQVVRAAWFGDFGDPSVFLGLLHSSALPPRNDSGYKSPKFDEFLAKASASNDTAERMELLQQAEKVLLEDLPVIPLYHFATKSLVSQRLDGWMFNIRDVHLSRFLSFK
ncbi:oligopeptide transport system substrate-binding protein [Azospirillaceae bacterium]